MWEWIWRLRSLHDHEGVWGGICRFRTWELQEPWFTLEDKSRMGLHKPRSNICSAPWAEALTPPVQPLLGLLSKSLFSLCVPIFSQLSWIIPKENDSLILKSQLTSVIFQVSTCLVTDLSLSFLLVIKFFLQVMYSNFKHLNYQSNNWASLFSGSSQCQSHCF